MQDTSGGLNTHGFVLPICVSSILLSWPSHLPCPPFHILSEANLNVSSASEPEATSKEAKLVQGESVEKETGAKEDDSVIYNIHLSLPGVSVPVEVVVSWQAGIRFLGTWVCKVNPPLSHPLKPKVLVTEVTGG